MSDSKTAERWIRRLGNVACGHESAINRAECSEVADELARLIRLLIHYGDMAGVPEDEMRRVCRL